MNTTAKTLPEIDLSQAGGGDERYKTLNRRVIYTNGVKYLADECGAYWLIDAIASYYGTTKMQAAIEADCRLESLHFWRLDVADDESAVLFARADSGVPPFVEQQIPYTDFPLESVQVWAGFDGKYWTLYLPSEH
jgi:hypothetical protein